MPVAAAPQPRPWWPQSQTPPEHDVLLAANGCSGVFIHSNKAMMEEKGQPHRFLKLSARPRQRKNWQVHAKPGSMGQDPLESVQDFVHGAPADPIG